MRSDLRREKMKIDQLILSLAKLGFCKYVYQEELPTGVTPVLTSFNQDSFVVWENQENFTEDGIQPITIVDVLFDEYGPFRDGRISFVADSKTREIQNTQFLSDQTLSDKFGDFDFFTGPDDGVQQYETINDLAWIIKKFKVNYQLLMEKLNAKN